MARVKFTGAQPLTVRFVGPVKPGGLYSCTAKQAEILKARGDFEGVAEEKPKTAAKRGGRGKGEA